MSRYARLRESIAYFAASAEDQLADDLGADEAVNETPYPLECMLDLGEITAAEVAIVQPLEELIAAYCFEDGVKPWDDEAVLFTDPLWAEIRSLAAGILERLPDEERGRD